MATDLIHPARIHKINTISYQKGVIACWISRDQRFDDNWALLFAMQLAREFNQAVVAVFTLDIEYPGANCDHFDFMILGLQHLDQELNSHGYPFFILQGNPVDQIQKFLNTYPVGCLVTDFDPLRIKRLWKSKIAEIIRIPFYEVDAHNIVPCRIASNKEEYGAYTLRPKLNKLLPEFLTGFPKPVKQSLDLFEAEPVDWDKLLKSIANAGLVKPINTIKSGSAGAKEVLEKFITEKLDRYKEYKNDPTMNVVSGLSAYLHFGHISSQHVAHQVISRYGHNENSDAFLEELIVRKELAENFCYYNPNYDNLYGLKPWASETLALHVNDEREYLYSSEQLENATTHDKLWNAAQLEMVLSGKMHGYMRMYWAKKILEWTPDPGTALKTAIHLNDKYSLDGRDPNGYAGCMWSIGGIHDRAWKERLVFGKIRYMNLNGCRRKFDVDAYIRRIASIKT